MTNDELNQYILHYLTEDKTNSAIMLTGDWGTGKSYYIQNSLRPYLEKEENGKHQCIVVSLYGIKSTVELSKAIYLECRAKWLIPDTEGKAAGKVAAKTIFNGVTSIFGINLSKDESAMKELYESIDLAGKLIVLEDLERSGVDIFEVLGYVNTMVEHDGVKVLFVANENEIISREDKIVKGRDGKEKTISVYTEDTLNYIRKKEKTISDTINYSEDFYSAINQIIALFENEVLNQFSDTESITDIITIMMLYKSYNLRSFILACQKTVDIFKMIDDEMIYDVDFARAVFFGIYIFIIRMKNGDQIKWQREEHYSVELGSEQCPLFKFCYDYIIHQEIDADSIQPAYLAYREMLLYDRNKSNVDEDVDIICNFYLHSEEEVIVAMKNVERRLHKVDDISFYVYGAIAMYSILINHVLNYKIEEIKRLLIENLRGRGDKIQIERVFRTALGDGYSDAEKEEYKNFQKEMIESMTVNDGIIPEFEYLPEQAEMLYQFVSDKEIKFHSRGSFINNFDIEKIAKMFYAANQNQKENIRGAFLDIYRPSNIKSFFETDYDGINRLLSIIIEQRKGNVGDKIQELQYEYFIGNLNDILQKLQ